MKHRYDTKIQEVPFFYPNTFQASFGLNVTGGNEGEIRNAKVLAAQLPRGMVSGHSCHKMEVAGILRGKVSG